MSIRTEITGEIPTPTAIRVETALSRFPLHRLARKGTIKIEVSDSTIDETAVRWKVSHNSEYGQPGPLAYKLDTLIVNRRIEEVRRPIPKVLKLGSLHDICRELKLADSGKNRQNIKEALYQNAFAAITAKISYALNDGGEKTLETGFTRYSVIFTGENLPDGRKADAVHIILNDVYMQVINGATTRPLDYDYLQLLSPAPQRLYEMLSYQMYAAIKHERPRARLVYSEFCTYAPQTRYCDWEHARKQMAKIHRPHKESGYIAKIDFQDTVDSLGQPDWIMLYQPGPKARADYRAFSRRGGPATLEVEPFEDEPLLETAQAAALSPQPSSSPAEAALISCGITPSLAAELAGKHDAETITRYIDYLEYEMSRKPGKIGEPAAWLFSAFKDGRSKPKGFVSKADRQKQQEAKRQADAATDAATRLGRAAEAADRQLQAEVKSFLDSLSPSQLAQLEREAIAAASEKSRLDLDDPTMRKVRPTLVFVMMREHVARLLQAEAEIA